MPAVNYIEVDRDIRGVIPEEVIEQIQTANDRASHYDSDKPDYIDTIGERKSQAGRDVIRYVENRDDIKVTRKVTACECCNITYTYIKKG